MDETTPAVTMKRPVGRPRKKPELKQFEAKEAKARAKLDNNKGDVEKLLFRQLRAFEWAQEAWIRGMTRGAAANQTFITTQDVEQGLKLATQLEKLVETQGRYLKEQKAIGGRLTEQEKLEAAIQRIMNMDDVSKRREVLRRMVEEHHKGRIDRGEISRMRAPAVKELMAPTATDIIAGLLESTPKEPQ
jgi:hypothetical protein